MSIDGLLFRVSQLLILADEGGVGAGGNGGAPPGEPPPNPLQVMLPMIPIFLVMYYLMVIKPQQKDQANRKSLLNELKKNDKVVTIGGIIGTVADTSNDGNRITLKVDDGTRIKFTRSSIHGLYDEKAEAESKDEKKK